MEYLEFHLNLADRPLQVVHLDVLEHLESIVSVLLYHLRAEGVFFERELQSGLLKGCNCFRLNFGEKDLGIDSCDFFNFLFALALLVEGVSGVDSLGGLIRNFAAFFRLEHPWLTVEGETERFEVLFEGDVLVPVLANTLG